MLGSQDLGVLPIHKCLCKKQLGFAMFKQFRGQNTDIYKQQAPTTWIISN